MFGSNSLLRSWPCQFLTTLLLIAGMSVSAAPPIWWTTPDDANFRVIDSAVTDSNPFGPANVGQGKYIAKRAIEALSAAVGDNAVVQSQVVTAIKQELYKTEENSPTGIFYPVVPDEPTLEWLDAQKVPLQIGAMKAMAAPFYRHLSVMNANWVRNQLIANGLTLGSGFFQDSDGTYYPWNPADNSSTLKNRAPATIGQLKVVFSLRFEVLDTDGNGIVDSADQNGDGVPDSDQDLDRDGLTGKQEKELGTDQKKWDSDGDLLGDGEDAVPTDAEINWKKAPENRYVWVEQMATPVDSSGHPIAPVAVNSTGLILFEKFTEGSISYQEQVRTDTRKNVLWDSAVKDWVTLSNSSSQTINIDERLAISGSDSTGSFKDINDAGTVSGIGDVTVPMPVADADHKTHGILSGLVWKKSTNPPTTNSTTSPLTYDAPTYYIHHTSHSIDSRCTGQIGDFSQPEVSCRIGIDNSINVTPYIDVDSGPNLRESVWMIHDGITNPAILDIRVQKLSEVSLTGGIIDKNRALCVIGSGLYLKDQNSVQLVTSGTIHAGETDIVLAPEKKTDNSERLWIAAGSTVLLEKRAGGNGAARWHNLTDKQNSEDKTKSMAEGAIRLNARGEAITPGKTDPTAPVYPKLWRNGKYTDLNDAKLTAKPTDVEITEAIDLASNGIILVQAKKGTVTKTGLLLPVEFALHRRGTINAPGAAISRPADANAVYEVVTLENADFDEQTDWTPNSMASAGETNRQDGSTESVDMVRDDDFVKIHLHAPLPKMPGSIELVMDQAGQGDRLQASDLRFYNGQGQRVAFDQLQIDNLQNPQGPLAPMLQTNGQNLFVEIADLGQLARGANQANLNERNYTDLILRLTLDGQIMEQKARIHRGGYWRNQRNGNTGTIAYFDGKGRYQDQNSAWQVDVGNLVHGPFNIQSGSGTTDETVRGRGPTPIGWYGLWERNDFRDEWEGRARPQTDHTVGQNGQTLGYLQQGSYCQWAGPGNRSAYTHQGANPPASVRFKFELSPWGHNADGRTYLQIHPDGFNDGTAGCVGLQAYNDCCQVFFLLRHYFGTRLNVETP